jgi:hypothetical protein
MRICPNGTSKVRELERIGSSIVLRSIRAITLEWVVNVPVTIRTSIETARKTTTPGTHGDSRSAPKASNNEQNQIAEAPCSLGSNFIHPSRPTFRDAIRGRLQPEVIPSLLEII